MKRENCENFVFWTPTASLTRVADKCALRLNRTECKNDGAPEWELVISNFIFGSGRALSLNLGPDDKERRAGKG